MTFELADVDLDVKDREHVATLFPNAVVASQMTNDRDLIRHKSGLHFQYVPLDPVTNLSSFPYEEAEQLGYYKVDLLPYHIYDMVRDETHMDHLVKVAEAEVDFPWDIFQQDFLFQASDPKLQLTQMGRHKKLCRRYPPKSIMDLATLNALIRPRKKYLDGRPWGEISQMVWQKLPDETGYFFKKSHAVAFALAILVHAQLILETLDA